MFSVLQRLLFKQNIIHQVTNHLELPALGRKAKPSIDKTWENAGSQTTANLQRAPGFCWLQDFHYQTNEHLFLCRLAVELLLPLNLPAKYHAFHKTCTAAAASEELSTFQHLCPRFGHPQTDCSIFSDSSVLEKSLFFSIHEPCQWWYKVSPTWIMIQVRAVIPWELNSGPLNVTKRQELQQPSNSNLCGREQSAPKQGQREKGLAQFMH